MSENKNRSLLESMEGFSVQTCTRVDWMPRVAPSPNRRMAAAPVELEENNE